MHRLAWMALAAALPVVAARGDGLFVTVDELADMLLRPDVIVLHVAADRAGFDREHIPLARFLPYGRVAVTRDGVLNELPSPAELEALFTAAGLGDTATVILYGDRQGLMAARTYVTLDYLGHGNRAKLLDGGFEAWKAAGLATTAIATEPEPLPFTARLNPGMLATADEAAAAECLLDARPTAEYTGETPGDGVPRPGHIPGAESLPWEGLLVSRDVPVLLPIDELRARFAALGLDPARPLVGYCRTGQSASMLYVVAKHLGYRVRLYDGSFSAWSTDAARPVER